MRRILDAAFLVVVGGFASGGALAGNEAPTLHVRSDNRHAEVKIYTGTKPIHAELGDVAIDKLHSFNCKSAAGCAIVVTASAFFQEPSAQTGLCVKVDGADAIPQCEIDGSVSQVISVHSVAIVSQGLHTAQTFLSSGIEGDGGAIIGSWETEYTLYPSQKKAQ